MDDQEPAMDRTVIRLLLAGSLCLLLITAFLFA